MRPFLSIFFISLFVTACGVCPKSATYREQYRHIAWSFQAEPTPFKSDYFLVLAVDASHLDYSNGKAWLRTMVKHPGDGAKNCDVGHAWIFLHGVSGGRDVVIEGGHSGELGIYQPKYFEGVMDNIDEGCTDPVKYLWEAQRDGFFQKGSGGHKPTFAAKVDLTKQQFEAIRNFVSPNHYDYSCYAITGNQCSSFVAQVAQIAGLELEVDVTVPIPQTIRLGHCRYLLWQNSEFSAITISSPDILEKSLMGAVVSGRAEYALPWYRKHCCHKKSFRRKVAELGCAIRALPSRLRRVRQFSVGL